MKISNITAYQVEVKLNKGFKWSGGRCTNTLDSTIVEIQTDAGITGYGESCPFGPSYLEAYAEGVRSGLKEVGPQLLGWDPRDLHVINDQMDYQLQGHPYVKSALDMACWDILGKSSGLPLYVLMGGSYDDILPTYGHIDHSSLEEMVESLMRMKHHGYKSFQVKIGVESLDKTRDMLQALVQQLEPQDMLIADANGGLSTTEAISLANSISSPSILLEQPCQTYRECVEVQKKVRIPIILDECLNDIQTLLNAVTYGIAMATSLKISRLGGLTKTKQMRDLCISLGMAVRLADTWCVGPAAAAEAHLCKSTPQKYRLPHLHCGNLSPTQLFHGLPEVKDSFMTVTDKPGLGIEPLKHCLGPAVVNI